MPSLHVREAPEGEWDMPVVELVEEGHVVGIAYLDGIEVFAEFHQGIDGEPWSFDVGELQLALDTALAILLPEGTEALEGRADLGDTHPVDVLATEFDEAAAHRGDEDEGFYPLPVIARMLQRAAELDLALVSLEAFTVHDGWVEPIPGQTADIGSLHDGEPWAAFKAGCNLYARTLLEKWRDRGGLAISVEVADRDGDRFVL